MRERYSESELIKTSVGDHHIFSDENITTSAGGQIKESCDGEIIYSDPETAPELKLGNYFKKGYWTNHKDEQILRAVYGQKLRFHIEFDLEQATVGDTFEFGLYDDDRNDYYEDTVKNVDDFINLIHPESGQDYKSEKIGKDGKTVIEFTTTDNLENLVEKCDTDKIFELYFRCSYNGKYGIENVELPLRPVHYLKLGSLVIDRYKMPGINPEGTDVAEDMCYGTGYKKEKPIYSPEIVQKYKNQYQTFGFDNFTHRLFSNDDNSSLYEQLEEEKIEKKENKLEDLYKSKIDNVYVKKTDDIDIKKAMKLRNKNKKAFYSTQECYDTFYDPKFKIPWTDFKIPFPAYPSGLDIRLFDNLSDEHLFYDFKNIAEFYFARGEMQDNLDELIAKFKRNEGGVFESEVMTKHALQRSETDEYCQKVEDYIAEQLKNSFSKLEDVEDVEPYFLKMMKDKPSYFNSKGERDQNNKKKEFTKPTYSYGKWNEVPTKATDGLTIALNDIWAAEVLLKELEFAGDNYIAKYEVILWDHFGLDLPDMEKIFNVIPSVNETFICWFILQHLRGYKPFFTKIKFEKKFDGSLQIGKEELKKMREDEKEKKARELNQKMRDDMWRQSKF
ncbi:MAG: DUF3289 family protein [Flavobacterium sp.]|nr:MAG: DUF3289 family protein [Flavobacterium sp.]